MKKHIAITIGVVALALAGLVYAAAQARATNRMVTALFQGDVAAGPWAHRRGAWMLERIAHHLSLTDDQKNQIKTILTTERPRVEPLIQQLAENHQEMRRATQKGQFDEAQVRAIAQQQAQTVGELIVEKERVKSQIYSILTPEQRARADQMLDQFEARMRERYAAFNAALETSK
jgi:protein CpxP